MRKSMLMAASTLATVGVTPAFAQDEGAVDDNVIIVTAQRQAQSLQEVPIAVSAFDADALEAQQIENASDLQLTLPNVTFTKSNFTASSFTIRGIGDLCVGVSCDSATAIHLNDAPLFGTRLFETEYFDLERVEVLRGPQGTLFGRNATSGVVNVVTAKPEIGELAASLEGEYGNFNSYKLKGMVNIPIGDTLAFRAAGFYLNRDGYTRNLFTGNRIDGRDMYAVRGSLRWEPGPDTTIDLMGYYFREDDNRLRIQKQLCQRDPTGVLGCLNNRRDFDKVNANSNFTGTLTSAEFLAIQGIPVGFALNSLYGPDGYAGFVEPNDVRVVNTDFEPEYFTDELQVQGHIEHSFDTINVSVTGTYQETSVDSRQDFNLGVLNRNQFTPALTQLQFFADNGVPTGLPAPFPPFVPGSSAYFAPVANALIPNGPGGVLCTSDTDKTGLGSFGGNSICGNTPISLDRSDQNKTSWSVEGIITSDFDGPFNFLLGGIYAEDETRDNNYFVNSFAIDYVSGILGAFNTFPSTTDMDPTNDLPPAFLGTPFFRSNTIDFKLKSYGIFGEVYWDISDTLKLTGGLRYNNDKKRVTARSTLANFLVPHGQTTDAFTSPFVVTFDADPGTPGNQLVQQRNVSFDEITGRAVLDWQMTPDNLIYLSYSRGYKSGGINPPLQPIFAVPESFGPEQIDAFEIGSKNVFGNGELVLNATAFYYKYKDLQLSRIVARTAVNDTIDADIYGVELEAVVRPDPDWMINMGFSWLKTKVTGDQFFSNPRDPGGGRADAVIIKDLGNAANCAVVSNVGSAALANGFVNTIGGQLGLNPATAFPADGGIASTGAFGFCGILQAAAAGNIGAASAALAPLQAVLNGLFNGGQAGPLPFQVLSPGVQQNIRGNALPQAPNVKASIGVQYTHNFDNDMTLVPRVDLTYTGDSFGNIFNGRVNKVNGYAQANAQIQLNGADDKWFVRAFIQNIFDSNSTTGLYITGAASGLFTNIFTLDPRRYGIGAGIKF